MSLSLSIGDSPRSYGAQRPFPDSHIIRHKRKQRPEVPGVPGPSTRDKTSGYGQGAQSSCGHSWSSQSQTFSELSNSLVALLGKSSQATWQMRTQAEPAPAPSQPPQRRRSWSTQRGTRGPTQSLYPGLRIPPCRLQDSGRTAAAKMLRLRLNSQNP